MKTLIKLAFIGLITFSSPSFSTQQAQLTEVCCPICEHKAPSFLPGGTKFIRHNCFCANCGSKERHRHLWIALQKDFPELTCPDYNIQPWKINKTIKEPCLPSYSILHWGGERPIARKLFARYNLNYVCVDAWQSRQRTYARQCDILNISYPDNSQDLIILDHVLDKIEQDKKALKELYRVLKPGGKVLFMVPIYYNLEKTYENSSVTTDEERLKHFDQENRQRKYGRDFPERLRQAGFLVTKYLLKDISAQDRRYYGLDEYDDDASLNAVRGADIFICTKPA